MEVAKREIFPTNLAMGGISEVKAEAREVIEQQLEARETLEGLRAGLGQQQKSRMKMRMQNASQCPKARRKSTSSRRDSHKSPFKMKPVPHDIHFEEVDAKKILQPFSHDKYIKE